MIPTDETRSIDFDVQERTNYHIGQLLRDEDFRTEQQYLMARDDRHQRMLHGYGTVFGLEVFIEKPFERIDEITVRQGVGVDRAGRTFVVHQPQCAKKIEEWWNANNRPRAIYVVARYDEIETSPVLLAGQPCDDTVDGTVNSRLRDSMALELWDHKPKMPIFEASRCMQQLLGRISLEANADGSDKKALISSLADICNSKNWQAQYRVTAKEFDEALDHWVTHVLPDLHAQDHNNEDFPWVLLAELHLARTDTPKLTTGRAQEEAPVRPLLLHTQLFQPPTSMGQQSSSAGQAFPQSLVTATPDFDEHDNRFQLELWFHPDTEGSQQRIQFADAPEIQVLRESGNGSAPEAMPFNPEQGTGRANVFVYSMAAEKYAGREIGYLRILIPALTLVVDADGNRVPLMNHMRANGILYEGFQPGDTPRQSVFIKYLRTPVPSAASLPIELAAAQHLTNREVSADAPEAPPARRSRRSSGKGRASS